LWSFGDDDTATTQNVTHTYTSTGTFTVELTAYNSAGSNVSEVSDYITVVKDATTPVTSFTADVMQGSAPLTVQFTDTSENTPTSWLWSFGDGGESTLENPSHTYATGGTYTVVLTAANTGGSDTITRSGYITVTTATTQPTVTITTPAPVATMITHIPATASPVEPTPTASNANKSSGLLPVGGVLLLIVLGIVAWIFLKRPPRGPRYAGGREL
jgi:PKD repeat protein